MRLIDKLRSLWLGKEQPIHLQRGKLGETAARKHLERAGLKFLAANYATSRGEIDLIFREEDCLVFVEVKTRTTGGWVRPAGAVNARKRRKLSRTALDYLRGLKHPQVRMRFDVVEVLLIDGEVEEIRHLPNTFSLTSPLRYG
jgi:putative endonuclease